MPVLNSAGAERTAAPRPAAVDLAERCLRRNPYPALKTVACDWLDGVLVLRGCLPTYYLKQIAQEVVAQQVQGGGAHRQSNSSRPARSPLTPGLLSGG